MAIVQISRITNRKGLIENLPQLAGAELGWAVDTRQLFIGNGTLQEGAPVIGNTEILTEFSDITAVSNYTYKDIAVGYAAQTGPTASDPVVRTVQAKLDDFADVRDFGAVGDGAADDTAAINRALFQLYCVEANTQIRRTLYFPAGTYKITETIIVPAYAKLVGEGANCTTIYLDTSSDISSLSAYVARYGDSLQQTGVNIGNNGATAPTNIEISSMTFQTAEVTDVFLVEDATQCYFDSVNFVGPLTATDIIATPSADNIAGVRFASTVSLVCNQITFDKCRFQGLTYGINTDQEINSVTVSNGAFVTLYQGISLGTGTPVNGGATGFRAVQNLFDEIYSEGIIYDNVDLNVSAYNVFYDVGNQYSSSPATPVVLFGSDNNVSISDMFERDDVDARIEPRVEVTGSATTTGTQIQVGHYARENGRIFTLTDNQSNQTIFTTDTSTIKAYEMTYTIIRDTVVRFGTLVVTAGSVSPAVSYADEYTEDASSGITLSVTRSGDVVSVLYSSTSTGLSGTITYSLARLA
jgi:polygalacturonase